MKRKVVVAAKKSSVAEKIRTAQAVKAAEKKAADTKAKTEATQKKTRGRHPGPEPKIGWPKNQCWAVFQESGAEAAEKLAQELKIAPARRARWQEEFPVRAKKLAAAAPAKTTKQEDVPAKKTTAKKPVAKKAAPAKKAA